VCVCVRVCVCVCVRVCVCVLWSSLSGGFRIIVPAGQPGNDGTEVRCNVILSGDALQRHPPCVWGASLASSGNFLFLFGGREMYAVVRELCAWRRVVPQSGCLTTPPLCAQTAGGDAVLRVTNALYRFRLQTETWELIDERDCDRPLYPQCRYQHSVGTRGSTLVRVLPPLRHRLGLSELQLGL